MEPPPQKPQQQIAFEDNSQNDNNMEIQGTPAATANGDTSIPTAPTTIPSAPVIPTDINPEIDICAGGSGNLRSHVWESFIRKTIKGEKRAVCKDCHKSLSAASKSGTSHLKNHIKVCLMRKQKRIGQAMLNPMKGSDGSMKLEVYEFDQAQSRRELANMIILHELPLSLVDYTGFRRFMFSVNPSFKVVTRNTIKNDILKIFEFEKEKCMALLDANKSRVSITTDMWTSSNQKRGFMTVTSHFIDDSWNLQSRLLR